MKESSKGQKPKAYELGYQNFYGRDFLVTPNVLIPRPETEFIIDIIFNLFGRPYLSGVSAPEAKIISSARILDVGTGSGCIPVTIKAEFPSANVSACDISEKALKIARENSTKFGTVVNFFHSDLLSSVDEKFDVITANLPYVDENWDWLNKGSLSFEPSLALYAEDCGLFLIKKLINQVEEKKATKYLILEADPCQHEEIKKYALNHHLEHIETRGFILLFAVGF